jgi:hypothetical protein
MGDRVQGTDTDYKGCRFRSRLEARWAVFFDSLGVVWEYESRRIQVTQRLTMKGESYEYLPDFWLPDFKTWVEVKGFWTQAQCLWFLDAASSILDGCSTEETVLVAGPLNSRGDHWPGELHMHKGTLHFDPWMWPKLPTDRCSIGDLSISIAGDYGGEWASVVETVYEGEDLPARLLEGWDLLDNKRSAALAAARGARFEHGESGAAIRRKPIMPPMPPGFRS